jgi:ankyrin repeat protein
MQLVHCPSLSPLHVAALKDLFDIVAWLLDQGASVDAPIPGSKTTALSLAVLGNHVPTALLLLANHADPDLREHDAQDLPLPPLS